ncbi:MAG: GNAT family N-acetyltransferase [Chloroflexota bacterium]|nr:GNAT family N-acetyltransferase [Chloroflexota bacterium]
MNRPLGEILDWEPVASPACKVLAGHSVRLEPIDPARHGESLYAASHGPGIGPDLWDYLPVGPFGDLEEFTAYLERSARSDDPLFYSVVEETSCKAVGVVSYLRIVPEQGVIEIGHIWFGPAVQRTPLSTEAIFLLMKHVFDDLGYRRLEWKCNALNEPSRRAALRFGFTFEGEFRQHMVVKGRNRDTAWFAMIDRDWPAIREAFERWIAPGNFDSQGKQRQSLAAIRASLR